MPRTFLSEGGIFSLEICKEAYSAVISLLAMELPTRVQILMGAPGLPLFE
jgi:hypothetical protein